MAKYEDGSYGSAAGIALIAKVLAGRCAMKYTRVAVGKGNIPDDKTPKTMTEPADYVMDAVIAGITNPVDGECQVTVQINSANVDKGFYCTAVVLYAISIHALREEGDIRGGDTYSLGSDFYPRPPRGGRPSDMTIPTSKDSFLSTPSARRATSNSNV